MSAIPRPTKLPQFNTNNPRKGVPELPFERRNNNLLPTNNNMRVLTEVNHQNHHLGGASSKTAMKRNASPSDTMTTAKRAHLRRSKSAVDIRKATAVTKPVSPRVLKRAVSKINLKPNVSSTSSSRIGANSSSKSNLAASNRAPVLNRSKSTLTSSTRKPTGGTVSKTPAAKPKAVEFNPDFKTAEFSDFITIIQRPLTKYNNYDFKARQLDESQRFRMLLQKFIETALDLEKSGDVRQQFEEANSKLTSLEKESISLKDQVKTLSEDKHMLEMKVDRTTASLEKYTLLYKEAKSEVEFLTSELGCLKEETSGLKEENQNLTRELEKAKEKAEFFENEFFGLEMERKRLHNTIMDLKGNIRVFARIRPPLECEREKMLCQWNMCDESSFELCGYDAIKKKMAKVDYTFDMVFHQKSHQKDVFDNVSPLIQSALDGYNICIFAYGQTGSGKSYTMDGTREHLGIIPRTVDLLFDSIKHLARCGYSYTIKASFLEIYNEVLCDLLDPKCKQMDIKMTNSTNLKDVYVSNLKEVTVETARELRELMEQAKMNRITACTVGNERSSRSHAVTNITVVGRHADRKHEMSKGTINLVDLAGSESPKFSTRMEETKNINRSLSELTNVMLALVKKTAHVPYRNSKLTHLLMPSLGGNSKTLMIVNVNPLDDCFQETNKSLRFASTVNSCTMAKAKKVKIYDQESFESI